MDFFVYGAGSVAVAYQVLVKINHTFLACDVLMLHIWSVQWFTAVELGLLKGRHPLLKDVDVTINPSKGLALVESRPSDEQSSVNNLLNLTLSDAIKGYSVDPIKEMLEDHDTAPSVRLRSGRDSQMKRNFELEGVGLHQEENSGVLQQTNSVDAEPVEEAGDNPADSERGEVLQTAQVVMNMLDITMPGTLAEEHKKKVLTAVEQGETLMKALQEAVPEDVRGKLRAAVSGIVQTQGTNLNLDGLLRIGQIPNVSSELKSKIQEKIGLSSAEGEYKEHHSSDQTRSADEPSNSTDNNQPSMERPAGGLESELQPSQNLQKSVDLGHSQSESSHEGDLLCSGGKDTNESERSHEIDEFSKERAAQYSDYSEPGSETGGRPNPHVRSEKASETEEAVGELDKVNQDSDIAQEKVKEGNNIQNKEEKSLDASTDQNKLIPPTKTEETVSPISLSEATPSSTKSEEPSLSILPDSNPPSFNVSQALDALTGMDDSTQMAVNSFFGVIENMITQLEEDKDNGNDGEQDKNAHNDKESGSASEGPPIIGENKFEKIEDNKNDLGVQSDLLQSYNYPVNNCHEKSTESHQDAANGWEKKPTQSLTSSFSSSFYSSQEANTSNHVDKENDEKRKEHLTGSSFLAASSDKLRHVNKIPLYITINPYGDSMYNEYLRNLLLKLQNTKSLDLDTTTALFLDYFPEEGQWKLLDQPGNTKDSIDDIVTCEGVNGTVQTSPEKANETEKIIEPSYVILDVEEQQKAVGDYETADSMNDKSDICSDRSDELMYLIKNIILDSLKVEVGRRLGQPGMQEMESNVAQDLEQVSDAVSMAVGRMEHTCCLESKYPVSEKVGTLPAEHIIRAISSAVQDAGYLRKILPVGVIVGSSLAGLRKYFSVAMLHDNGQNEAATLGQADNVMEKFYGKGGKMGNDHEQFDKNDQNSVLDSSIIRDEKIESKDLINDTVMVSAVTAALGASALLVRQQRKAPYRRDVTAEVSSKSLNMKGNHQKELYKHDEAISEQNQNNGVTSLAEKAMSVAGPVVPTKSDGEVDQDRLVAMLADWGQKGGMLRLIGKVALLWGGIRGAMSLTDKLILFLRIAERPLFQRILGFVCMVLVLWSPVVVPLFPTLVQSWATHNSSRIAEFACVIGLYTAVMILVKIWGKRIRGYENPFEQYGLDLTSSPKLRDFLKGLIGGVMLILSIHSINALLGYACLSWPLGLPSSSLDAKILLKVYGRMLILAGQGIVTATGVAIVEELLYRSWLPEEIAVDLGYHRGFIISGLAFSIFQRSPHAIPGLWLLSLGLAGARQRSDGSLSLPIGMRAGIMASSFILEMGGFLTYRSHSPLWLTGAHPFQPFGGVVGLAFSFLLALVLYPRQPLLRKRIERTIRE
ncbi:hypothetical protein HHK36_021929 [Tetracentron sinense]|uniref:Uncharacterized protein n=1 Tax=Tetracentron sinense TaxID=13715 RepID=A0A834YXV5_TETSI|nr:hypothetical protein HHK36_021929 [Tetracentron sinense]